MNTNTRINSVHTAHRQKANTTLSEFHKQKIQFLCIWNTAGKQPEKRKD